MCVGGGGGGSLGNSGMLAEGPSQGQGLEARGKVIGSARVAGQLGNAGVKLGERGAGQWGNAGVKGSAGQRGNRGGLGAVRQWG